MSRNIPDKEMKTLIALSGGVCAFPGCNKLLVEPGNPDDDAAFLGEMAHIIADSRQGPRGDSPMSDEDRDKHTNLLLLCGDHHKTIDAQPRTYSVSVLHRIKEDHEGRIRQATSSPAPPPAITLTREVIHSSLLAVKGVKVKRFLAASSWRKPRWCGMLGDVNVCTRMATGRARHAILEFPGYMARVLQPSIHQW
jgi:hypothetical protein